MQIRILNILVWVVGAAFVVNIGCDAPIHQSLPMDPPQALIGERLFKETRFAQFFAAQAAMDVNAPLTQGDPILETTITRGVSFPGPFQGKSMNCSACHLVDQHAERSDGGMRSYTDFARRSPIPERADGRSLTPRNSPSLVNASLVRGIGSFFHFDGEFTTLESLVRGTLTGRNYGWLADESSQATAQIAKIIREDDGKDQLASEFGGWSYAELLLGTNERISPAFRLSPDQRLDVRQASDEEIVSTITRLIAAYVDSLRFSRNQNGQYDSSPYDAFLKKNALPRKPEEGESEISYSRRLLEVVNQLEAPKYVAHSDGQFTHHPQAFLFSEKELQGMKIFFGSGNCIACHAAPNFTDFRFHNTGVAQVEYDELHGDGRFAALPIPDLATRRANPEAFLPATPSHPNGLGAFLAVPSRERPQDTDLGLWNVFANDDLMTPQSSLIELLCDQFRAQVTACTEDELLPLTIAYFKTPSLRDLGHSAPYLHNGQFDELSNVVDHYRTVSDMIRNERLRNPSQELLEVHLSPDDTDAVVKFLKSLNEDYE